VPMIQIYGATETSPFAIYQHIDEAMTTIGSIGRAGVACQVRLVRPDGTEAADGEPGEIWVSGKNILEEYWRDPEETERAIADGWFRTGDVATRSPDGLYWFTDRIKHVRSNTSSSQAAKTSTPPNSNASCAHTQPSPRSRLSAGLTPNGARSQSRLS